MGNRVHMDGVKLQVEISGIRIWPQAAEEKTIKQNHT